MELLVHLHHGTCAARGQALGGAERNLAIRRGLPSVDAELLFAVVQKRIAAAKRAAERATNPHLVLTDGLAVEQVVERCDALYVRRFEPELFGNERNDLFTYPAVLLLAQV